MTHMRQNLQTRTIPVEHTPPSGGSASAGVSSGASFGASSR
jgi:hypothetical protein